MENSWKLDLFIVRGEMSLKIYMTKKRTNKQDPSLRREIRLFADAVVQRYRRGLAWRWSS